MRTGPKPEAEQAADAEVRAVPLRSHRNAPGTAKFGTAFPTASTGGALTDVEGDGRTDILLDHPATGGLAYWRMQGADVLYTSPNLGSPPGYERIATGDFDGDGRVDIVWVNQREQRVLFWLADGRGGFTAAPVGQHGLNWRVFGAGDVDGDGKSDLLLRADNYIAYWAMDGATILRQPMPFTQPEGLTLVAHGDFNGDRRLDIVWEAPATRTLSMWLGRGDGFTSAPVRAYVQGWKVWGAGDINGDGKSDLLLTHPSERFFAYWLMDGATPVRYSPALRLSGEDEPIRRFGPVAVGDYNGDGKLDILSSRERDRELMLWFGDGNGFVAVPTMSHTLGWRVARSFATDGAPVRPYVHSDADGDGKSDFLVLGVTSRSIDPPWQYEAETGWNFYDRDGVSPPVLQYNASLGGRLLATGDFDGDARADAVIEKDPDNQGLRRTVIRLSTALPQYEVQIPTPAAGWRIVAANDVDGDGLSDLLLGEGSPLPDLRGYAVRTENPEMRGFAYWVMARGGVVRRYSIGFVVDPAMSRLVARGDFDGDTRLDLVWGSPVGSNERRLVQWQGDGNGFRAVGLESQAGRVDGPAEGWHVFGAGDVNGDGKSDLLLQQSTDATRDYWTGIAYWTMDRNVIRAYSPGFRSGGGDRAFGDYNGDGYLDFVFVDQPTTKTPRFLTLWTGDGNGFRSENVGWICGRLGSNGCGTEMIFNR